MGKIYLYRVNMGNETVEVICATKAEADKERKFHLKKGVARVLSSVIKRTTPYLMPVKKGR